MTFFPPRFPLPKMHSGRFFHQLIEKYGLNTSGEDETLPFKVRFPAALFHIAVVMSAYLVFEWWLNYVAVLPESGYYSIFLAPEVLSPERSWAVLLFIVLAAALLVYKREKLLVSWSNLAYGRKLHAFITLIALMMTWSFAAYPYNFYYNQGHVIDRMLLLLLCGLVYWKPVFVIPFLFQLTLLINQFNYPLGIGLSRSIDTLPVHILIFFSVIFLRRSWFPRAMTTDLLFTICVVIAAYYWWPGYGKLQLNWITHGQIYFLPLAAYTHGWLAFVDSAIVVNLAHWLSLLDWPMRLGVLALECGSFFFLWKRITAKLLLIGWIAMHAGIFILCGYFFWKWALLDIALFYLFLRNESPVARQLFRAEYLIISFLLIATVPRWVQPAKLAWYDTPLSYQYHFETLGESGKHYTLAPDFFGAYSDLFAFGRFSFITSTPQLVGAYGACNNRETAEALLTFTTARQVFDMEKRKPAGPRREEQIRKFDNFFTQFIQHLNSHGERQPGRYFIPAPAPFWTFEPGEAPPPGEQLTSIIVRQVTALASDTSYSNIRERVVREIDIMDSH